MTKAIQERVESISDQSTLVPASQAAVGKVLLFPDPLDPSNRACHLVLASMLVTLSIERHLP